jgi:N-glycosylase/DNA lyase
VTEYNLGEDSDIFYRGYNISFDNDTVIVDNIKDFNLTHTFECGQCFRWNKEGDGSYTGIAHERVINVSIAENKFIIRNTDMDDFKKIWFHYFDLARDYGSIKEKLIKNSILKKAVDYGYGIRILNQDIWEALISFIISTNSNIPRIKRNIDDLSREHGREIIYRGKTHYAFPDINELANSSLERISLCKSGYRCTYIKETAEKILKDNINLKNLEELSVQDSIKKLCTLKGVGEKVSACALLFSGTHQNVFPVDVWIRKTVEEVFLKRSATLKEIHSFADETFGPLKGFAQQYLFYYMRNK